MYPGSTRGYRWTLSGAPELGGLEDSSDVPVVAPESYLELVYQVAGGNTLYVPGQYPRVQVDLEWGSGAWGT